MAYRFNFPEFVVKRDDLQSADGVGKLFAKFQARLGNHIGEQVDAQVDEHIERKLREGGHGRGGGMRGGGMGGGGMGGGEMGGANNHRWKDMVPYSLGSASPGAAGSSTLTADLKGLRIDEDTPLFIGTNGIVTVVTGATYDGRTQYIGPGGKLPAKAFDPSTSDEYIGLNLEGPATQEVTVTADVSAAGTWFLWTYVPRKTARRQSRGE